MSMWRGRGPLGLFWLVGVLACEEPHPSIVRADCPSWEVEIRAEVEARCTACHPSFSSYGAIARDEVARAPRLDSPMLTELASTATITGHRAPASTKALFTRWIVDCGLRYAETSIHSPGLMDPREGDFHAALWQETQYSTTACRDCHGSLTSGRGDAPGCETCHAGGEEACSTCHAQIESQGAHRVHLRGGALGLRYDCELCHVVPAGLRSPGHVLGADGRLDIDSTAEVQLSPLAGPSASYLGLQDGCANVACHVAKEGDTAATDPKPRWGFRQGGTACNRCHGEPPAGHVADRCTDCHPAATLPDGLNAPRHLNGQVELGRSGAGTCDDCHGAGPLGAPPPDLAGRTSSLIPSVGAHAAHLSPARRLGNPAACADCHLVPDEIPAPGHVDTLAPAEVFPPEIQATSLAFDLTRRPEYRPGETQCANVYCHGAALPDWTKVGLFEVACGTCHDIPPNRGSHDTSMDLFSCHLCHASSIDAFGNFIFLETAEGPRTVHIDGRVDL